MTDHELSAVLAVVLDKNAAPHDRAAAMKQLTRSDAAATFDALIQVVTEENADHRVSRVAGECLAELMIRRGTLGKEHELLPLHDFTGEAYVAYDNAVSRHGRRTSNA